MSEANQTTDASPMKALLDSILDNAENGEAQVKLHLRSAPMPAAGALRRHAKIDGIYEFLVMAQESQNSPPFPLSLFFAADGVARVMVVREELIPKIAPSNGSGLIIPSG